MKINTFQHLASFGISGVKVPVEKIGKLLSTKTQIDALGGVLRESTIEGPSLQELPESDLSRVNFDEKVRGGVQALWQPIVEDPTEIPPPQLLEKLNKVWNAAARMIGDDVQSAARAIFEKRAAKKAEIIRDKAVRLAVEDGIPSTVKWLQCLKEECGRVSKVLGQEVLRYERRKEKQKTLLEDLKEDWGKHLTKVTEMSVEPQHVARNFLVMAGIVLLVGLGLWILSIPVNSILGVAGVVVAVLVALKISWPLFRYLGMSRQTRLLCTRLTSAYKAMSLFSLDELAKRLELEYCTDSLPMHIDSVITGYQDRIISIERRKDTLSADRAVLHSSLHNASATVRTIVRDGALRDWYTRGLLLVPKEAWVSELCSIDKEPLWGEMEEQARAAFEFLRAIKAEDEIFSLYETKEDRIAYLTSLREAAIGRTPGEPLISIDFSLAGERPMENHLTVEIFDPEHSNLARDLQSAWGDAGVGLSIVPSMDASAISFVGLVYGFPFEAIKDYSMALPAFVKAKQEEGDAIYPYLYPALCQEGGAA